jgi:hypothetical protein
MDLKTVGSYTLLFTLDFQYHIIKIAIVLFFNCYKSQSSRYGAQLCCNIGSESKQFIGKFQIISH